MKHGDEIDHALPPAIRIESDGSYEIDARVARIRGTYRIDRDSIFFDETDGQSRRVAFAGQVRGDTLDLDFIGASVALSGPPDAKAILTFVRTGS